MKIKVHNNLKTISFEHTKENDEASIKRAVWKKIKKSWKPNEDMKNSIKQNMNIIYESNEKCSVILPDFTPAHRDSLETLLNRLDGIIEDNKQLKEDNKQLKEDNKQLKEDNKQLKEDNKQLKEDNKQVKEQVGYLLDFLDPIAKRFLFEKVREKVWSFKVTDGTKYKTDRWNKLVNTLTEDDCAKLHLGTKDCLKITMFTERPPSAFEKKRPYNPIDEASSTVVHDAKPEYIASMIQRAKDDSLLAIFRCVYDGKEPEMFLCKKRKAEEL